MSTTIIIILCIVVVALLAVGVVLFMRQKRSEQLRETFGPEYEREVAGASNRSAAEKDLLARQKRHHALDIRPLERDERAGYRASWEQVQRGFVDSPGDAVREADRLVIAIMTTRGYPTDDFDQRADDVSVEHPDVVEHYRRAHQVAVAHERGDADTEQLRQAAISYRSLVQALLKDPADDDTDADQVRADKAQGGGTNGSRAGAGAQRTGRVRRVEPASTARSDPPPRGASTADRDQH